MVSPRVVIFIAVLILAQILSSESSTIEFGNILKSKSTNLFPYLLTIYGIQYPKSIVERIFWSSIASSEAISIGRPVDAAASRKVFNVYCVSCRLNIFVGTPYTNSLGLNSVGPFFCSSKKVPFRRTLNYSAPFSSSESCSQLQSNVTFARKGI